MAGRPKIISIGVALAGALALAGCSSSNLSKSNSNYSPRVVKLGEKVPAGGGVFKVGKTYSIKGRSYTPAHQPDYDEVGLASWYGRDFHGRKTANGEVYDMGAFTAAHKTLPLPVYARVTNVQNGKSVVVRINDRGPFAHGRIIDLSRKTAEVLGFTHQGTAKVRVQYVGRAPLDGQDDWLTTTVREDGTDRRVARVDREIASRAFASDGVPGANTQHYRMAASAYSGRRSPAGDPLRNAPARTEPQPTMVAGAAPLGAPLTFASSAPAGQAVQAGVFRDPDNAYAVAARLQDIGLVSVEHTTAVSGTAYRVTVRPRDPGESLESLLIRTRMAGVSDAVVAGVY